MAPQRPNGHALRATSASVIRVESVRVSGAAGGLRRPFGVTRRSARRSAEPAKRSRRRCTPPTSSPRPAPSLTFKMAPEESEIGRVPVLALSRVAEGGRVKPVEPSTTVVGILEDVLGPAPADCPPMPALDLRPRTPTRLRARAANRHRERRRQRSRSVRSCGTSSLCVVPSSPRIPSDVPCGLRHRRGACHGSSGDQPTPNEADGS
jgi:hypothetical protein